MTDDTHLPPDDVLPPSSASDGAADPPKGSRLDRLSERAVARWARLSNAVVASRAGQWWTRTRTPGAADWAPLVALFALTYVVFLYKDVQITLEHSFNFLDAVFSWRLRDFYTISIQHTSTGHPAVYDVPLYAVFAVWNLPTYVIYKITGFGYLNSTPAELWLKTMIVVTALASAKVLADFARDLGVERPRTRWVAFFFLSSMSVFMPVFIVVQYDILLVLVMLLAMRAYVRGSLRGFLGWFLFANTLKLFTIFLFIPLVLLREKRIRVAIAELATGMLGIVACRLLYLGDLGHEAATGGFTAIMMERLKATHIGWIGGGAPLLAIPLFVVFIIGLAVFAYAVRPSSERERNVLAVYLGMAVYLVFMALVPLHPYWIVLVAPFTILIIFLNPRHFVLNSLLEAGFASAIVLIYSRVGYSMYTHEVFEYLLLPHITAGAANPRYATPNDILIAAGMGGGNPFIIGFMVACGLSLLILNYPGAGFGGATGNTERVPRSVVWARLVPLTVFTALLLATYFVPAVPVAYTTAGGQTTVGSTNILAPGASVTETLEPERTIEASSIGIGFLVSSVAWFDSSEVTISVLDEAGTPLLSAVTPVNQLRDGIFDFSAKGLVLQAGRHYTFSITASNVEGGAARVMINPDVDRNPTTDSGAVVAGDLVMIINGSTR